MRPMNIAIAAVLAAALVWSVTPTAGNAPHHTVSMDPLAMMTTTTHSLPEEQYDQGTIF
jgi:hypothetical protein